MKIAIHHRQGSFSDRWIAYCKSNNIDYKIVNAFDSDIILQLIDCDALMWHHHHGHFKDVLNAKRILFALEHAGTKVFPDFKTGWHFDDKVAQKYLLEAIDAPLVPSYVFYDKREALDWAKKTSYPKVFKLKGGAGAANVKLVRNQEEALKLINKAFGKGFAQFDRIGNFKERYNKFINGQGSLLGVLKGLARIFIQTEFSKQQSREKGYIYFQKFISNNKTDFRIKVVDSKCWGFQRGVRENDFRASGSGKLIFNNDQIPNSMINIALNVSENLGLKSVAFDFVIDNDNKPLIVEMSYGSSIDDSEFQNGYWDRKLTFYSDKFNSHNWMIESLIREITTNDNKIK